MKQPLRAAALSLLAAFFSACAASFPRIVQVGPPLAANEENSYADEDLYLTQFNVNNLSTSDTPESEAVLRKQFISYLRDSAKFRSVIDATSGATVPAKALRMNVDLQPDLQDGEISFMAGYYEIFLLYAISPRSGATVVNGTATLLRDRHVLSTKTWNRKEPFSYTFFGLFRMGPIESAFQKAYQDVFAHIVVPTEAAPEVSKAELRDLVQASLREASKKNEKVYNSDVDKPGYQAPENPDNFAVVIGIEKYQQLPAADFGERDARTVKEHLVAMGFPQRNIAELTGNLATRSNVEKYLESWLPAKVNDRSRVVVYFSGHGAPDVDSKQAFLVPWDGDTKFLQKTAYPLKRLYQNLNALPASRVIVMLDSCFSGAGGRSVLPQGARPLITKVDEGAAGAGKKLLIVSASDADEISLSDENQGHGLFTYYLLKGLNEQHGAASIQSLYDYLLPRVQDAARQQNRDQTPKLIAADGSLTSLPINR